MRFRPYRFPCEHPAVVVRFGERLPAQIINVSAEGARLSGPVGLTPGETLLLELGPGSPPQKSEVHWVRGALSGLRFANTLSPRQIAMVRRSVGTSASHRPVGWNLQLRELR